MPTTNPFNDQLPLRVRALRSFTWALLIGEWLVGLLWPPVCLVLLYLSYALIGGLEILPKFVQPFILAITLLGMLAMIIWRWPHLLPPQRERIDQRLMLAARLRINPFAALEDRPAQAMATAQQLWQVAGQQQQNLWPRLQRPKLRPLLLLQDPQALRYLALLGFLIAGIYAGPQALDRLYLAVQPGALQSVSNLLATPQFTLTLTPPAFTGQSTRVLTVADQQTPLLIPQGSKLAAQVQSGFLRPRLLINGERVKFTRAASGYQIDGVLQTGDQLAIYQGWRKLAAWPIHITAPTAPIIKLSPPKVLAKGQFVLAWQAKDIYGLQKIALKIILGDLAVNELAGIENILWATQGTQLTPELQQTSQQDLAAHRLAGMKIKLFLQATNTAGLITATPAVDFILPERIFNQELAQHLANMRKELWAEENGAITNLRNLVAESLKVEKIKHDTQTYLALQNIAQQLQQIDMLTIADIERINTILWRVAVRIEEGAAADYAQNLQTAGVALEQALQNPQTNAEELARLTNRYEIALQNYLANTSPPAGTEQTGQNAQAEIGKNLQQELQALKEALAAGSKKAAMAHLQNLQTALQNVQAAHEVMQGNQQSGSAITGPLDPLGRPLAQNNAATATGVAIPLTADIRQQAKVILNELRDRANAPDTDAPAQDYYQRLLQLND